MRRLFRGQRCPAPTPMAQALSGTDFLRDRCSIHRPSIIRYEKPSNLLKKGDPDSISRSDSQKTLAGISIRTVCSPAFRSNSAGAPTRVHGLWQHLCITSAARANSPHSHGDSPLLTQITGAPGPNWRIYAAKNSGRRIQHLRRLPLAEGRSPSPLESIAELVRFAAQAKRTAIHRCH